MNCCACLFLPASVFSMPFREQLTCFQLFHLGPSFLEGVGEKRRKGLTVVSHCYVMYSVHQPGGRLFQTTCLYSKVPKAGGGLSSQTDNVVTCNTCPGLQRYVSPTREQWAACSTFWKLSLKNSYSLLVYSTVQKPALLLPFLVSNSNEDKKSERAGLKSSSVNNDLHEI